MQKTGFFIFNVTLI